MLIIFAFLSLSLTLYRLSTHTSSGNRSNFSWRSPIVTAIRIIIKLNPSTWREERVAAEEVEVPVEVEAMAKKTVGKCGVEVHFPFRTLGDCFWMAPERHGEVRRWAGWCATRRRAMPVLRCHRRQRWARVTVINNTRAAITCTELRTFITIMLRWVKERSIMIFLINF